MEGCRWEGQNLQLKEVQRLMKKNVHKHFEIQQKNPKSQLNIAGIFCPAIDDTGVLSMRYILPLCFLLVS
jgi:hypothetical protein